MGLFVAGMNAGPPDPSGLPVKTFDAVLRQHTPFDAVYMVPKDELEYDDFMHSIGERGMGEFKLDDKTKKVLWVSGAAVGAALLLWSLFRRKGGGLTDWRPLRANRGYSRRRPPRKRRGLALSKLGVFARQVRWRLRFAQIRSKKAWKLDAEAERESKQWGPGYTEETASDAFMAHKLACTAHTRLAQLPGVSAAKRRAALNAAQKHRTRAQHFMEYADELTVEVEAGGKPC